MPDDIDQLRNRVDILENRLNKGIQYDEKLNVYVVVWTAKELAEAKKEAEELFYFFNQTPAPH